MQIITTETLLTKYGLSKEQAVSLLTPLSPNIMILPPATNYMAIKMVTDPIKDSILLIGGHDIIPFALIQNPCNDSDQSLHSDALMHALKTRFFTFQTRLLAACQMNQLVLQLIIFKQ